MAKRSNSKKAVQKKRGYRNYVKWFWKLYLLGVLLVVFIFMLASWGVFGYMPTFEKLENPELNIATEIISSDNKIIGKFFTENRTPIEYDDLPPNLVNALIATEDERYLEHSGIDGRSLVRAIVYLSSKGGASTITQQLAKLLFHGERARGIERYTQKIKEWVIAVRLEKQYTKQEIVAMYLNTFDFLHGAKGVRSASRIYFGKEPKDLKLEECAVLVAMLKNPRIYNPKSTHEKFRKNSLNRRNQVLKQMQKNGFLTEKTKLALQKKPLELNYKPEKHIDGIATYFREHLKKYLQKWVKDNPKEDGSRYNIYQDGLKIYTTINSSMQNYAEQAVKEHLTNLQKTFFEQKKSVKYAPFIDLTKEQRQGIIKRAMKNSSRWKLMKKAGKTQKEIIKSFDVKTKMRVFTWAGEKDTLMTPRDSIYYYKHFLHTGLMALEPHTGHIKAWVGGINYKHFQYDHVAQGARQVGSTFKPILYATVIDQTGASPCDSILDESFTIPKGKWGIPEPWTPSNSDGKFKGMMTLQMALANSVNTVSAKLMDRVGPKKVVDMAKNLGIKTKIPQTPSIALGAAEVRVSEMVAAYSTFANKGVYIKPEFVVKIEDKNGKVLHQVIPQSKDVLNQEIAYTVLKLLEGVTKYGSGRRMRWGGAGFRNYDYRLTNAIAGKTGPTQNYSDGWFIGMIPNLATGVWVGNEDRAAHFGSIKYGQGATMSLPIWALFMEKCYADKTLQLSKEEFEKPASIKDEIDCQSKATNPKESPNDLININNI